MIRISYKKLVSLHSKALSNWGIQQFLGSKNEKRMALKEQRRLFFVFIKRQKASWPFTQKKKHLLKPNHALLYYPKHWFYLISHRWETEEPEKEIVSDVEHFLQCYYNQLIKLLRWGLCLPFSLPQAADYLSDFHQK